MMRKDEIRAFLVPILEKEVAEIDAPTEADWRRFETRFATQLPKEFKTFIELMSEFSFPGDIYNIAQTGRTNGNDRIETIYESEVAASGWPANLIPFYGIGNGDYFALDKDEGPKSAVYYRYHEDGRVEKQNDSFADWLKRLPAFLSGEG